MADLNRSEKRILLVDDEPMLVQCIMGWLVKHGYQVETASDGIEALEKLRAAHFDLLMTDVMMPRMNGIELFKAVRADSALSDLRVFLLGTRAADKPDPMPEEARKIGADAGLGKPFSPREICSNVDRILAGVA